MDNEQITYNDNAKKVDFSQLLNITRIRIIQYAFSLLNLMTLLFFIIYASIGKSAPAGNVFGTIAVIILCADIIYCVFSKSKLSLYVMVCFALGIFFNHLGIYNLSPNALYSFNALAVIPIILLPVIFTAMQIFEIAGLRLGEKLNKIDAYVKTAFKIIAPIILFVFCLFSYDSVYNYGESVNEYTTTRAAFVFAFAAFTLIAALVKLYFVDNDGKFAAKIKKYGVHMLLIAVIGIFTVSAFIAPYVMIPADIAAAERQYTDAFGSESLAGADGERSVAFNMADRFIGINTPNYACEKDVVYYNDPQTGLTLRYDAYLPTTTAAHKSVMIYIHGRNGDKGNSKEKCRYFAGQGYVVFDIQVGDSKEKGINYIVDNHPTYEYMIDKIYKFVINASADKKYGENWQSVFITGASMGGGLTLNLAFLDNRFDELGVGLKGILPIYPPINALITVEDVKKHAIPCLMLMGTHDGFVDTWRADELKQMYANAGSKGIAVVWINYAGHGCDAIFADRASQIYTYFAERFMRQFK